MPSRAARALCVAGGAQGRPAALPAAAVRAGDCVCARLPAPGPRGVAQDEPLAQGAPRAAIAAHPRMAFHDTVSRCCSPLRQGPPIRHLGQADVLLKARAPRHSALHLDALAAAKPPCARRALRAQAPFCVHPKTGKVCVPIDPSGAFDFDPDEVPTVHSLLKELPAKPATKVSGSPPCWVPPPSPFAAVRAGLPRRINGGRQHAGSCWLLSSLYARRERRSGRARGCPRRWRCSGARSLRGACAPTASSWPARRVRRPRRPHLPSEPVPARDRLWARGKRVVKAAGGRVGGLRGVRQQRRDLPKASHDAHSVKSVPSDTDDPL